MTSVQGVVKQAKAVAPSPPKNDSSVAALPPGRVESVMMRKAAVSPDHVGFALKSPSVKSSANPPPVKLLLVLTSMR